MSLSVQLSAARTNRLLATLPEAVYQHLLPTLEPVTLAQGDVVYKPGSYLNYCYFPTTAVVSLLYTMERGMTLEVGSVGNEGALGISVFISGSAPPEQALVQVAGSAFRMRTQLVNEEFRRGGPFQQVLLRYTQVLITQISQTVVCNRFHPLQKRLCRWFLLAQDRVQSTELSMTQEFIAQLMGVRREAVTVAAHRLRDLGLIHCTRGHITILDRKGLEAVVCKCYWVIRRESDRLLGQRMASGFL